MRIGWNGGANHTSLGVPVCANLAETARARAPLASLPRAGGIS